MQSGGETWRAKRKANKKRTRQERNGDSTRDKRKGEMNVIQEECGKKDEG
jgi:hypothetical protein